MGVFDFHPGVKVSEKIKGGATSGIIDYLCCVYLLFVNFMQTDEDERFFRHCRIQCCYQYIYGLFRL